MTYQQPDAKGFYGKFGGQFVPETLMTAVIELDKAYREAKEDPSFQAELDDLLKNYVGRETPLYHALRGKTISLSGLGIDESYKGGLSKLTENS